MVKNNATISNLALNAQNELNSFHNTTDAMIKEAVHAPNKLGTISEGKLLTYFLYKNLN